MPEIIKDHDDGSYFWIMPVRVKNTNEDTDDPANVDEYRKLEISIEEDDVYKYLYQFLIEVFEASLKENLARRDIDGGFEWYLTYNYFTLDQIKQLIEKVTPVIDILESNDLKTLDKKYNWLYNIACGNTGKIKNRECLIKFYKEFVEYMQVMIKEGSEEGYNLVSFMGP